MDPNRAVSLPVGEGGSAPAPGNDAQLDEPVHELHGDAGSNGQLFTRRSGHRFVMLVAHSAPVRVRPGRHVEPAYPSGMKPNVERLAEGTAFVDVSAMRVIDVSGSDARTWLNDLVSADLSDLDPGSARPTLLLAPTGGIRAAFTVVPEEEALLLLQDPSQQPSISELLAPYVLSSDVTLADRTGELSIFAFPGLARPPEVAGARASAPSALGVGSDLLALGSERDRIASELEERFARATDDDAEAWRIAAGIPRVGVDTAEGDLPQEAALDDSVAFDKGCFVGQEAVAKTRNLGHPRRVLLPFTAEGQVGAGEAVRVDDEVVGSITSAARLADGIHGLARIRWADRARPLRTESGIALTVR